MAETLDGEARAHALAVSKLVSHEADAGRDPNRLSDREIVLLACALLAAEQRAEAAAANVKAMSEPVSEVEMMRLPPEARQKVTWYFRRAEEAERREKVLRDALERIEDTPHYEAHGGRVCPPCMAEVALHRGKVAPHKAAEEEK